MNGSGSNGSGSGHDHDENPRDENPNEDPSKKVLKFPTLAERDRQRREKLEEEKKFQAQYKKQRRQEEAFINWHKIPIATRYIFGLLLLINVPVLLLTSSGTQLELTYMFGFVPGIFTGSVEPYSPTSYAGPLTHMLLHGGWTHFAMNLIMGVAFTVLFERALGPRVTAKFFILCGLGGALTYFILSPFGEAPVIGASGAISGMFGAALMMMYQMGQLGAMGRKGPWPVIMFWLVFMILIGFIGGANLAWQAHVGGYITGVLLLRAMQTGKIKL